MNILVIGSGGREHAIVKKLARDGVAKIYCAPGNAGMVEAECAPVSDKDVTALADFAVANKIDLTIVGPEHTLVAGIVDEFSARGLRIFGPMTMAAQLEGSKAFAKRLMAKHGIPTAEYAEFTELEPALAHLRQRGLPIVIKADGLAAGKGVVIPESSAEAERTVANMLCGAAFGAAGSRVVIEEFLDGEEFSLMAFVNGTRYVPMPIARDYKRAFDGDQGLNTGGMGANSPHPLITEADYDQAIAEVIEPTVKALNAEGIPYTGVLYAGLIKTAAGIKVIEFNVRFGDPETEVVLPRLDTPLVDIISGLLDDDGAPAPAAQWSSEACVGVVLAAEGYPGTSVKGARIQNLDALVGVDVCHMGTARAASGDYVTNGGRVLCVVGKGASLTDARDLVYGEISKINCSELFHRNDIAGSVQ